MQRDMTLGVTGDSTLIAEAEEHRAEAEIGRMVAAVGHMAAVRLAEKSTVLNPVLRRKHL